MTKSMFAPALIAAGLAIGAAILALMALAVGLIAFFLWLEPQVGSVVAMSSVAGILLVLGIILTVAAMTVGRKEPPVVAAETPRPVEATGITTAPTEEKIPLAPPEPPGFTESPPTQPVTSDDVEALFAIGEQFARIPHTGIESVDNVLRSLAPKAEDAAREAVVHAASLVRYGDRSTMLATLGVALAIGWAMTRLRPRHEA